MHAFSGEFALADRVAGASRGAGAHMTIDAFGAPWTFFTLQNRRARVILGVDPDAFVVVFTQHIIVPVLAL